MCIRPGIAWLSRGGVRQRPGTARRWDRIRTRPLPSHGIPSEPEACPRRTPGTLIQRKEPWVPAPSPFPRKVSTRRPALAGGGRAPRGPRHEAAPIPDLTLVDARSSALGQGDIVQRAATRARGGMPRYYFDVTDEGGATPSGSSVPTSRQPGPRPYAYCRTSRAMRCRRTGTGTCSRSSSATVGDVRSTPPHSGLRAFG